MQVLLKTIKYCILKRQLFKAKKKTKVDYYTLLLFFASYLFCSLTTQKKKKSIFNYAKTIGKK